MTGVVLQGVVTGWTRTALLYILGFGLYAGVIATGVAFVYRAETLRPVPVGAGILLGVSLPAIWLNIESVVGTALVGSAGLLHEATGAYLLGVFFVSAVAAEGGRRTGDHLACEVYDVTRLDAGDDAAELIRSAGLAVEVELPETVADATGYPAVEEAVKDDLAGETMLFPRRLSPAERRDRLIARIEADYGVGHVEIETDGSGAVTHLAVGGTERGIGPSLPPGTVAVALRTDPSPDASVGDPVEVWGGADGPDGPLARGTLLATAGDTATVVVDAEDAAAFATGASYRLVTRPGEPNDVHELVSVIRAADETVTAVTVEADGSLDGEFAGWLPTTVPVIEREGEAIPFPLDRETLQAGDTAYVLGTPAEIRDLAAYERDRRRETGVDAPTAAAG
jgi:hypothetical protein